MRVEVSPRSATVTPGQPSLFSVLVFNNEPLISGHSLRVLGADATWASLDKQSLSLFPGASATAVLSVTLPKGSPAGPRRVSVEVRELTEPGSVQVVDLDLEVPSQRALVVKLGPQSVTAGRSASVVALVANTGNTTENARLEGSDEEGKVSFTFAPPQLRLAPGEAKPVGVGLRAPRPLVGSPRVRPFTLKAPLEDDMGQGAEVFGTFVQKPWLTRGYVALVGLLAAATVFAAVLTSTLSQLNTNSVNGSNAVMQALEANTNAQLEASGGTGAASLSGAVRLAGGQPGAGVTVDLFSAGALGTPLASRSTSADGRYSFAGLAPGAYKVEFQGAGLATVWYPNSASPGDASSVVLSARQRLRGLNVTISGLPAQISGTVNGPSPGGATVTLESSGPGGRSAVSETTTGAAGNFSLAGVPSPGAYNLVVTKPGFATATLSVALSSGEDDAGVNIFLEPGDGSISGTVSSPSGPLGGATVTATVPADGGPLSTSTVTLTHGKVGTFVLRDLPTPAQVTLQVSAPGYASQLLSVALKKGQQLSDEGVTLAPASGTIAGKVTLVGGAPAGGVRVTASEGQFSVSTTTTTLTMGSPKAGTGLKPPFCLGCYVLSGLPVPGTYQVTFSRPDLLTASREVELGATAPGPKGKTALADRASLDVTLEQATATVFGRVRTRTGQGVGGVTVLLASGSKDYRVTSADIPLLGEYEVDEVAPGQYTLSFSRPGAPVVSSIVTLAAGERLQYNAVVGRPAFSTQPPATTVPPATTASARTPGARPHPTTTTSTSTPASTTAPAAPATTKAPPPPTTTASRALPATTAARPSTTVALPTTTVTSAPTAATSTSLPTTTSRAPISPASSTATTASPLTSPPPPATSAPAAPSTTQATAPATTTSPPTTSTTTTVPAAATTASPPANTTVTTAPAGTTTGSTSPPVKPS